MSMKRFSEFGIAAISAFLIYFIIASTLWFYAIAQGGPYHYWERLWMEHDAVLPVGTRLLYILMWGWTVIFGMVAYINGIQALLITRRGIHFDPQLAQHARNIGLASITAMIVHIVANCYVPVFLTQSNVSGVADPILIINPQDFAVLIYGIGFLTIGRLMRYAIAVNEENKAFV